MCRLAAELEEDGQLAAAAEMYRAAMAAAGPKAEICFQVAELLYRQGDLAGARERYYMAIELDEDYVEARANLGCVLAETGQRELAVAAFEGALRYHPDYADVHYHLARTLDEMHERPRAEEHWRAFVAQAPDSPWADEARGRLKNGPRPCRRRILPRCLDASDLIDVECDSPPMPCRGHLALFGEAVISHSGRKRARCRFYGPHAFHASRGGGCKLPPAMYLKFHAGDPFRLSAEPDHLGVYLLADVDRDVLQVPSLLER